MSITPSLAVDTIQQCSMPISNGKTLYVGGSGGDNYTSIQSAIDDANPGDTVFVYDESSPYYENLEIYNQISLIGEDKNTTIIDGQKKKSTIHVLADCVNISGFTIQKAGTKLVHAAIQLELSTDYRIIDNIIINNSKNGIILLYVNNTFISQNYFSKNGHGIYGIHSNYINITNNNFDDNGRYGIIMAYSNYQNITNNLINYTYHAGSNTGTGIWEQSCDNNRIINNSIFNNCQRGIDLYESSNYLIYNNTIIGNGWGSQDGTVGGDGISIRVGSKNNIVKNNLIKENKFDGISLYNAGANNQITGNTIEDSDRWGMEIKYTYDKNNWIYNNNFINNTQYNAIDKGNNKWNNTYPIGGNYWDDYTGIDDDGDGLGDEPYFIAEGDNKDYYPLINKWGENAPYADFTYTGMNLTVNLDASLSIDRDGTIISYYWEFPDGTTGTGKTINHTFPSYDNYTVYLTVTDDDGRNHTSSKIVVVEFNYAPYTPDMPSGPILVQVNESEMYSTSTNDPNDDMVQFRCDLDSNGSHNFSEWSSFVSPGETVNISLMWNSGGIYVVKAQARDEHGFVSNWSDGLTVLVNIPPVQPFDPEPEDEAHGVDINADLSWSCSDPEGSSLTYNVFFEKNDETPDVLVSENQTEASFDPGTMEYGSMYYWQIVAWDNYSDSTASPVWCFVTMIESNDPPYMPSDPIPEDDAMGVDVDTDLGWIGGDPDDGDTVFYDVYLEVNNPDPSVKVADDIVEACFDPGLLEPGTVYFWKIVARDNHFASTDGPVWQFTTIDNDPPNLPIIEGPTSGKIGVEYEYNFSLSDPNEDKMHLRVDWGSGTPSKWYGPYDSDTIVKLNHTWDKKGTYSIRAQTQDNSGLLSDWGTLTVTMPRTRAIIYSLFQLLLDRFTLVEVFLRAMNLLR